MVTAFVLINIDRKDVRGLARTLADLEGVTEVYPVAGEHDLICVVRVMDNARLSQVITDEIIHLDGVRHTKTLFALDAYTDIDLAQAFGLQ